MNYDKMTNEQIDELVELKWFGGYKLYPQFKPCSKPSHAWPIILDCRMDIKLPHPEFGGVGTVTAYNPFGTSRHVDFTDKYEALRAAMICYLMMEDDEQ